MKTIILRAFVLLLFFTVNSQNNSLESITNTYSLAKKFKSEKNYIEAETNYTKTYKILATNNLLKRDQYSANFLNEYLSFLLDFSFNLFLKEDYRNSELILNNSLLIYETHKFNGGTKRFFGKVLKYTIQAMNERNSLANKNYNSGSDSLAKDIFNKSYYFQIIKGFSQLYRKTGNLSLYNYYSNESLELAKKIYGKKSLQYVVELSNVATANHEVFKYGESLKYCNEAINIYTKLKLKQNYLFVSILNSQSLNYQKLGNLKKAEIIIKRSFNFIPTDPIEARVTRGLIYRNLGMLYYLKKDYKNSILNYKLAIENLKGSYYKTSLEIANLKYNLANSYSNNKDYVKAKEYYISSYDISFKNFKNYFYLMSNSEKEMLMDIKLAPILNSINSFGLKTFKIDPSIVENLYNHALFRKGLLLRSSHEMKNAILESNNSDLIALFDEWNFLKNKISKLKEQNNSKNENELINLKSDAKKLEKILVSKAEDYNDIYKYKETNWKNVHDNLKYNESSIEFINFEYYDQEWTNKKIYCALLLKPNSKYPELIYLCEENELLSELNKQNNLSNIESLYGTKENPNNSIYNLIWKPLDKKLNGVEKVYISPSGLLNKLSFSSISNNDKEYLINKYDIIQLNSTSLINSKALNIEKDFKSATLFGAIDYGNQNEKWSYLKGTELEVDELKKILSSNNILTQLFTNKLATEINFKNNIENSNIIHIATHGFFNSNDLAESKIESTKNKEFGKVVFENRGTSSIEIDANNDPLLRSGLIFANANNYLSSSQIENGVLTALEVSQLNINSKSLVVLSACETGLGEIKDDEGVYGLQRSFKIAGAKYLIFSLWKVPDLQTKEFMTIFYKEIFISNNIREAFIKTQRELSLKYDPYYWASFVLIE